MILYGEKKMNLIEFKTRLKRVGYMLQEKGLSYTWNFLFMTSTYNNDFIRYIVLTRFYPWFVFYPRYFEIEVTTRCHLKCIMCEHTYWTNNPKDLSLEEFKRIIDQFPKLKWIGTTGIGSSFLNKDYPEMLKYLKNKNKNIYVELFDAFSNIKKQTIDDIVKYGLIDRLIISIDGANKETYEKIRVGADFETVIGNVKYLIETKNKYNTNFPELSFHFIISRDNYLEVPKFVELVASISQGKNIGILFSHVLHNFQEVENLVVELPPELKSEAIQLAGKFGIKVSWGKNVKERKPINRCTEWSMPFIFADGSVIQCCASNEANRRDFQVKNCMGNILKSDFDSIWNGTEYSALRDAVHSGKVPVQCSDCPIYERERSE